MDPELLVRTRYQPDPTIIHKPNGKGTGRALKVQLKLDPQWITTTDERGAPQGGYFDRAANKRGGLFLELAPQGPKDERNNPTFLWRDDQQVVRAKLGLADITKLLVAHRSYRVQGTEVPTSLRGKSGEANQVELVHKFADKLAIITYTFEAERAILQVSKVTENRRASIALALDEEYRVFRLLERALDAFTDTGKR